MKISPRREPVSLVLIGPDRLWRYAGAAILGWIWFSLARTLAGVCLSLRLHPVGCSIRAPTDRRLALAVASEIERGTSVEKVLAGDEPMMEHEWRSA